MLEVVFDYETMYTSPSHAFKYFSVFFKNIYLELEKPYL